MQHEQTPSPPSPLKDALSVSEAAALIGIPARRLCKLREIGRGPAYLKVGKSVLYTPASIASWLQSIQRETADTVAVAG